ncbi:MAG TPA: hypothetical protein VLT91_02790 [Rhizomicrobium sp.]|nr:hypothetical protein [Rhizomicrobium sp.]
MVKSTLLAAAGALLLAMPALAADVNGEIVNAQEHAEYAAAATDLNTAHAHLHHALNCLVGPNGTGFDAKQMNPCANSGNGIIPDTTDAAKKKTFQAAADKAMAGIAETDLAKTKTIAGEIATMLK